MPLAWDESQGSSDVTIAIIDDFIYQDIFTFDLRFAECAKRVQLKEPFSMLQIAKTGRSIPHGEPAQCRHLILRRRPSLPRHRRGRDVRRRGVDSEPDGCVSRPSSAVHF